MANVPDSWEDDWIEQSDTQKPTPPPKQPQTPRDLLEAHHQKNLRAWDEANTEPPIHFLEATSNVPLAQPFKAPVKILSRRPVLAKPPSRGPSSASTPQLATRNTNATSPSSPSTDDEDDSRGGVSLHGNQAAWPDPFAPVLPPTSSLTPEEVLARQQKDLEEKQRRYEQARVKIFGQNSHNNSPSASTSSLPRSNNQTTPSPASSSPHPASPSLASPRQQQHHAPGPRTGGSSPRGSGKPHTGGNLQSAIRAPRGPDETGGGFHQGK